MAAIDAVLFLETSDIHFKQAIACLERSYKLSKKSSKFTKEFDKKFSEILTKVKKGNLAKEDKIQPNIP